MFTAQDVKGIFERLTGIGRPTPQEAKAAVRIRKANVFRFAEHGLIPNNPDLPVVLYRSPIALPEAYDPAAIIEETFERNGWADGWRDGIYDYIHYHSQTHEVLGIARGYARVLIGGPDGRRLALKAGDVVILPAGTGHKRLSGSSDLLVVGAYPALGEYDECRSSLEERDQAIRNIAAVPVPKSDPVYGKNGPLLDLWCKATRKTKPQDR